MRGRRGGYILPCLQDQPLRVRGQGEGQGAGAGTGAAEEKERQRPVGSAAYVKFIKPNRSSVKVSADPDEYDFPDEEYINEDEPAEAETEAEHE